MFQRFLKYLIYVSSCSHYWMYGVKKQFQEFKKHHGLPVLWWMLESPHYCCLDWHKCIILDGILYLQNICHLIDMASSAYVNNVVPIKIWLNNAAKAKTLWHKVDISNFQCHKNVNFHNNFGGLMIADDLKNKIWKLWGKIF